MQVRLFGISRQQRAERLLWSREARLVRRLAEALPDARVLDLDSGSVLVGSAATLTDALAVEVASSVRDPPYGLIDIDQSLPVADRYLIALSAAVQASGLAERIGMAQTRAAVASKSLDYFFTLRAQHQIAFQPIVDLSTGLAVEYECLLRPHLPGTSLSVSAVSAAAIAAERTVELDMYAVGRALEAAAAIVRERAEPDPQIRFAINVMPASLLDDRFSGAALADLVTRVGLRPEGITIECTEQQAVDDVRLITRRVRGLRRRGFGVAVDDAGAGYASFSLIASLRPTTIKIDFEIVHGIARDDAKQALVDAFVSFGRRIGARLVAEGIETRADLATLAQLGVPLGQGYLLGRPAPHPRPPRPLATLIDGFRPPRTPRAPKPTEPPSPGP